MAQAGLVGLFGAEGGGRGLWEGRVCLFLDIAQCPVC